MSLSAAIATIVVLDVALLAFLAWMMSHPRHLKPHVSQRDSPAPEEQRFFKLDPTVAEDRRREASFEHVG